MLSSAPAPAGLPTARFDASQYLRMVDAGILGPHDKVELIAGVVVLMSPAVPNHHWSLVRLNELFVPAMRDFHCLVQGTVVLGEGEVFDPDFALLKRKPGGYRQAHPRGGDVELVVEVSASSLPRDRQVKLPVYAASGIPEFWIVDLEGESIQVYREPRGNEYRSVASLQGADTVSPLACDDATVTVSDLFAD
ncbi:MAG: Uma2 family endonuclease [Planctomycetota bacterium]